METIRDIAGIKTLSLKLKLEICLKARQACRRSGAWAMERLFNEEAMEIAVELARRASGEGHDGPIAAPCPSGQA